MPLPPFSRRPPCGRQRGVIYIIEIIIAYFLQKVNLYGKYLVSLNFPYIFLRDHSLSRRTAFMKNAYSIIQHNSIRTAENALPKRVQFICAPGANVSLFPSPMHDFGDFQISASGKAQAERAVSGARYE
jgi:hypothetical protein